MTTLVCNGKRSLHSCSRSEAQAHQGLVVSMQSSQMLVSTSTPAVRTADIGFNCAAILDEARSLADQGVREITLSYTFFPTKGFQQAVANDSAVGKAGERGL